MICCNKCGKKPVKETKFAWKCGTCGKAFGTNIDILRTIQLRKKTSQTAILKCKNCGKFMDVGYEYIYWRCGCGNVQRQLLKDAGKKVSAMKQKGKVVKKIILLCVCVIVLVLGIFGGFNLYKHIQTKHEQEKQDRINQLIADIDKEKHMKNFDKVQSDYDELSALGYDIGNQKEIIRYERENIQAVEDFLAMLQDVNDKLTSRNYTSLRTLMDSLKSSMETFNNMELMKDSELANYIKFMRNSAVYQNLWNTYVNSDTIDLDYWLTSNGYSIVLQTTIDGLLDFDYPYDKTKGGISVPDLDIAEDEEPVKSTPLVTTKPTLSPAERKRKILKKIKVTVYDKKIRPKNYDAGRYSDFIELDYKVENNTKYDIKGIKGILHIKDQFDEKIMDIQCDISIGVIVSGGSKSNTNTGLDYNEFRQAHNKLYSLDYSDLIFEYEIEQVNFTNGKKIKVQ